MDRRPDPRIEVEPLSDARWARTERALFERLEREVDFADALPVRVPRWRSPAALVVAGAVAASIGALASRALWRSPDAPVASHIETGDSRSHLVVGGATIDVAPRSDVIVSGDGDHGVLLVLDKGGVDCEVASRHGRPPFVVQAGDVRVRVVGTHFAVAREADGVRVDVTRGVVEVDARGETQSVAAGAHWPSAPALTQTLASPEALAPSEAPSAPLPSASSTPSETSALAHVAVSPRRAPAPPATSAPREPAPDAPATNTSPTTTSPTAASSTSPVPPRAPTAQNRYEAAARLESSDPAAALASYRAISRDGSDAWAANALYAAGRLEADRGARDDARALLEEYVARFPRGLNAPDARELLERVRHPTP